MPSQPATNDRSKYHEALRVSQLDVDDLDESVVDSLLSSLQECFKYPLFGMFDVRTSGLTPHVRTALYGFLSYHVLVKSGETVGQQLLKLR